MKIDVLADGDAADPDGDGLDNATEAELGTDPWWRDSDGDGLEDGEEIAAGTEPLLSDTDGGGANDGWEVSQGFDPLDPTDDVQLLGPPDRPNETGCNFATHTPVHCGG